jgi:predicted dehydrogenase
VTGAVKQYSLAPHWSRLRDETGPRSETQEHGLIEFDDGRLGIFHWTNIGYDSPLRWWRSSRFLAEKGMGVTVGVNLEVQEWLSLLAPGGEAPHFITLERRWERVDGGALVSMVAHTGDPGLPIVRWDNPFKPRPEVARRGQGVQWHDDEIGVAGCLMSLVHAVRNGTEPGYGPHQARLDQELILAIRQSALEGGRPVSLPLDPAAQKI